MNSYTGVMSTQERLWPQQPVEITPGAVHIPGWLSQDQQQHIVASARQWGRGPVPFHSPAVRNGAMSVQLLCLGWHWLPYRYTRTADNVNGASVLDLPQWLLDLGQDAVRDAAQHLVDAQFGSEPFTPDTALVNYYPHGAKMGMHQDREEQSTAPVVS